MFNGMATAFGFIESTTQIEKLFKDRPSRDFDDRRNEARFITDVHRGIVLPHIERVLHDRFHIETFDELKIQSGITTQHRIMADILDKAVVEWDEGAAWTLVGGDDNAEVEDTNGDFANLMEVWQPDTVAREIAVEQFLHRALAVVPTVIEDEQGRRILKMCVYTPEFFSVRANSRHPHLVEELALFWHDDRGRAIKQLWSPDSVSTFRMTPNKSFERIEGPLPNRFGIIPAVFFHRRETMTNFWPDSYGSMLAQATVQANAVETLVQLMTSGQIKVLGGVFKDFPQGQAVRHAGAVNFGTGENIGILDFQTDLAGLAEVGIARLRKQASVAVGLNVDEFTNTSEAASGQALRMRYWNRDRIAMKRREPLRKKMIKLYWTMLTVLFHELKEGPIEGISALPPYDVETPIRDQSVRLQVNPNEPEYPELQAEQQAREEYELAKGFTTRSQLMMKRDPDISAENADILVQQNLRDEARFARAGLLGGAPRAPLAGRLSGPGVLRAEPAATVASPVPRTPPEPA